ncbi:MAG: NAD-dependent epimerase/dehydratase family protein [Candidatus Eisenbacteria bacterium]
MRVVVTGGAGFIGSHLVEALLARGESVTVVDNLSTGRFENLAGVRGHGALRLIAADVRDPRMLADAFHDADCAFHLAAHVGVRRILRHSVASLLNNVQGTVTLLERAARQGTRVLLFSSSEVYGKGHGEILEERDDLAIGAPCIARWSYAAGKAVDEALALAYHAEQNLPVTVLRCFNTCGPRQTDRDGMVLPTFVRQALAGAPLTVHGDGRQTRCFSYVGDVVRGALMLLEAPGSIGEIFNVGNDEEVSILELARKIVARTGSRSPIQVIPYENVFGATFEDVRRRVPCLAKIRAFVGYEPRVFLDELLDVTVASIRGGAMAERAAAAAPTPAPAAGPMERR